MGRGGEAASDYRSAMGEMELQPVAGSDLATLCAIQNRAEAFDGVLRVTTIEELAENLDDERVVFATDTRVAYIAGSTEIAGYAYTYHLPSDVVAGRCYVFGHVDPAWRGRGVGRALMAWGVARATEQLRAAGGDLARYVRVESFETMTSAHRLFERMGFTPIRWFEDLLRPLVDLPALTTPPGVSIVPWPDEAEGRDEEIRTVKNLAFADHWGSAPANPDDWRVMVHGFGSRLDLSRVAVDDATGQIIGHCLIRRFESDDVLLGRREGWIDSLGTLSAWRGRGVASALISAALHAFAADGLSHAAITVDSENPSGAARLYRSLGFELHQRTMSHQIEVPAT